MAPKNTLVLALAHYEGASRGCTFRVRELAYARVDFEKERERALSQWWEYSRSAVGQLCGCDEKGCYWCTQPHRDCGRVRLIRDFHTALNDIELAQRKASRDEHTVRYTLLTLRAHRNSQHPPQDGHAARIIEDFERGVLGPSTRSPVEAEFSSLCGPSPF